jgi:pimeloyl-ACP methyl ester carboxylesterase
MPCHAAKSIVRGGQGSMSAAVYALVAVLMVLSSGRTQTDVVTQLQRSTPVAPVPVLTWSDCGEGFQCADADLPLDYRHPHGRTISIALIRRTAADPARRIGSLFFNPGGPGGSGVNFVRSAYQTLPDELRARFDIVGFDPRGVARSSAVNCWSSEHYAQQFAHAKARLDTDAFTEAVRQAADFHDACVRNSKDLLPFVGTGYVARDLDLLRAAVGDQKLSYFGASYGTYLGTVYASLFPTRVRGAALDGAYDPEAYANRPYDYDRGQHAALDAALQRFFAWCADTPERCRFGHGNPAAAFDRLLACLDAHPVTVPAKGTTVTTNAYELLYKVLFYLNGGRPVWPLLGDILQQADERNDGLLVTTPWLPPFFASMTANTVVECADRAFPQDQRRLEQHLAAVATIAPRFGPALAYGPPGYDQTHAAACSQWPAEQISRYEGPYHAKGSAPILVVGTTGDPDTPYHDAVALARTLDNASLLTFKGEGHTAFHASQCAKAAITTYLTELILPPPHTICADAPPPMG